MLVMTVMALAALLVVTGVPQADEEPVHSYVGADGCKMCHKSASKGDQYGKWLESKHSKAYEVLGTDAAKEAAAKAGVEGNPQEADACLQCHVTAHGVAAELLGKKYSVEQGVGCESCHGPGSDYKKKSVMEDREAAIAAGMVIPNEETCKGCHNEKSPTFKGFKYEEAFAKIAHPYPEPEGE
jgi:hypothetical protein